MKRLTQECQLNYDICNDIFNKNKKWSVSKKSCITNAIIKILELLKKNNEIQNSENYLQNCSISFNNLSIKDYTKIYKKLEYNGNKFLILVLLLYYCEIDDIELSIKFISLAKRFYYIAKDLRKKCQNNYFSDNDDNNGHIKAIYILEYKAKLCNDILNLYNLSIKKNNENLLYDFKNYIDNLIDILSIEELIILIYELSNNLSIITLIKSFIKSIDKDNGIIILIQLLVKEIDKYKDKSDNNHIIILIKSIINIIIKNNLNTDLSNNNNINIILKYSLQESKDLINNKNNNINKKINDKIIMPFINSQFYNKKIKY
jgi:hypothetical protein|tara:strand:+ start:239 stop:1189 length:951 start_codon:yes stop_codon:yes gene_type:complete